MSIKQLTKAEHNPAGSHPGAHLNYSIASPRVLFDLGIEKKYSAKLYVSVLVPRLL